MDYSDYLVGETERALTTTDNSLTVEEEAPEDLGNASLWDPLLTKQLRALLHTDCLLHLQHSDKYRLPEYQHYASLTLAIKVFDLIISHTGLGQDLEYDQIVTQLLPLLEAMDREHNRMPERDRQRKMAERILGALLNEDDGRQPFRLTYTSFEEGNAVKRALGVRLLEERYQVDGRVVLRLSNESANLMLNALTVDLEDAQAAAEAIIQSQLARGRIDEARISSQWALQQSVRLRDLLERRLADTRRDFLSVNWKEEMHRMVQEALVHVSTRCSVENSIVATAREQREQLVPGSEKGYQLSKIIELIEACRQQHLALQRRLLEAPRVFFEEQERQIFTFRPPPSIPHPQNDLLFPLLQVSRIQVSGGLNSLISACVPATPPPVFSLARYLSYLLQPRRETAAEAVPIEFLEIVDAESEQTYFTGEILQQGEKMLAELERPTRLSEVIQRAQEAGKPLPEIKAMVFLALDYFDPEDNPDAAILPVDVRKTDERQFWLEHFAGDDVMLYPGEDRNGS
ncbi:MAG TPA: hypothetical protein VFV38_40085 [Ktedonobacteraceae bacterium]|nr:hypothetical protein [Ktedonobacteraceae bacterium]